MLNKKNIAMSMAAATAFSAVAPTAFAAQGRAIIENAQENEIKELKENVYNLLNTTYVNDASLLKTHGLAGEGVYTVEIEAPNLTKTEVKSYSEFVKLFDKSFAGLKNGQQISVSYKTTEGFNELENGDIVDCIYNKYTNEELNKLDSTSGEIFDSVVDYLKESSTVITLADGTKEGKLPISNGEFITVREGDTLVSRNKPKFKVEDGHYVDQYGTQIKLFEGKTPINKDLVAELKKLGGVVEGYYPATSGASKADNVEGTYAIVKSAKSVTKEEFTVSDLYDGTRFTVKGNEIRKGMVDILTDELGNIHEDNTKFEVIVTNNAGKVVLKRSSEDPTQNNNMIKELLYTISTENVQSIKVVFSTVENEKNYNLTKDDWTPVYEITVTQARGEKTYSDLINAIYDDATVRTLAGMDRYKTAVEMSEDAYATSGDLGKDSIISGQKTVVLVSGDSSKLVDGLTATPLANVLDAPILLTQAGSLNEDTLKEIERLKATHVVIVGGESAISTSIENELKKVHALNVTRLSGDSRYETSMAVANKIADLKSEKNNTITAEFNEVFVVGGNGEADALSVAAIAAEKQSPILLTPATKLDADVKNFINKNVTDNSTDADVYVVGGTNSVSASVQSELVKIKTNNDLSNTVEVKRLAGEGRQETNAAVITEFKSSLEDIVVAKSDNKGMVDALAAGAYAAKKNSHIVLATNSLTEAQEDAIAEVKKANTTNTDTLVQAGYNVAKAVISGIVKLIK